eukprot:TRINITY_DN3273_c1_g2_i2.p2 TRINITY_DN3273_c1_g2~~TRINITY_DN3273_c1_g2_i2.p2  ORF type:complete len:153 (-),score=32.22 TRINITY_DN3273_c1_g2_i2:603-1061(-)
MQVVGAVMAWWYMKDSGLDPWKFSGRHTQLGAILVCGLTLQLIGGFLRPGKESRSRRMWKVLHGPFGLCLFIFALGNIVLGIRLLGEKKLGDGIFYGSTALAAVCVGTSVFLVMLAGIMPSSGVFSVLLEACAKDDALSGPESEEEAELAEE